MISLTQETKSLNKPQADAQSATQHASPSLTLEIDQHRNHLAILESYHILRDLMCSPSSNLSPECRQGLRRALLRIQFFLMHSNSPILTASDRLALARVQFHDLGASLHQAEEQRREVLSRKPLSQ